MSGVPPRSAPARAAVAERPSRRHERWQIFSRVIAANLAGYALAALFSAALALVLPLATGMARASSVLTATLLSFAVYTAVAIWVFSTRSATRAWVGLAAAALVLAGICMALGPAA